MEIIQLPTKSCYLDIYNYPLKETIILPWSFGHLLLPSSRKKENTDRQVKHTRPLNGRGKPHY